MAFRDKLFFSNGKTNNLKSSAGIPGDIAIVVEIPFDNPAPFLATDTVLFFQLVSPETGRELWRTNGTQTGTYMVSDLYPGTTGSDAIHAFTMKGVVYFLANDGVHGVEIYKISHKTNSIKGIVYQDVNKMAYRILMKEE